MFALLSAAACDDRNALPSVVISDEEMRITEEEATYNLPFVIENPVDGASVEADAGDADWISEIVVSDDRTVSFVVAANNTGAERMAVLTLTYKYSGGECSDNVNIIQQSVQYDYSLDNGNMTGYYLGPRLNSASIRYLLFFTENPYDGGDLPEGMNYIVSVLSLDPVDTQSYAIIPGVYVLDNTYEPGTLNVDECRFSIVSDGTGDEVAFVEGSLSIAEASGEFVYEINLVDENGKTHHVTYSGPVMLEDQSDNAPMSTLTDDYEADLEGALFNAYYRGDYQGNGTSMWTIIVSPRGLQGDAVQFDLYAPPTSDLETGLPMGTYNITEDYAEFTIKAGYRDYGLMSAWWYAEEYGTLTSNMAPLKSGTMTLSEEGGKYSLVIDAQDDKIPANNFTASWTGDINCELY